MKKEIKKDIKCINHIYRRWCLFCNNWAIVSNGGISADCDELGHQEIKKCVICGELIDN